MAMAMFLTPLTANVGPEIGLGVVIAIVAVAAIVSVLLTAKAWAR